MKNWGTVSCTVKGRCPCSFTENETNQERLSGTPNLSPYVKDGINNYLIHGQSQAVNPEKVGTKAAAHYVIGVGAGDTQVIRLRLNDISPASLEQKYAEDLGNPFGSHFDEVLETCRAEADEFYQSITPPSVGEDAAGVMRQALAGMLWSKQYYHFDADKWLQEHGADPLNPASSQIRNKEWFHMFNDDIISMPDKWEYPWYAGWDLAFQSVPGPRGLKFCQRAALPDAGSALLAPAARRFPLMSGALATRIRRFMPGPP